MRADTGYNAHAELPELYDSIPLYNSRPDIDFYIDLCRQAGEVLELGCGTGRILIPAAEAGAAITGLDQSKSMLARCRAKADALPDDARQCNDIQLIYYLDGRRLVQSCPLRYFFRFELEHLLARSGFEVTGLYGAFDRSPFADDSPEMIFTATRVS